MSDKVLIESCNEARRIIDNEGIGYAVLHYCTEKHFEDKEVRKLWKKARLALEKLNKFVDDNYDFNEIV